MVAPKTLYESARGFFVEKRNVLIVVWRDAPDLADIRAWHRLGLFMAKEHATSACIDVVVAGTPRFSDDVRRAAEELARDERIFPLGIAHVLLIPGLGGSAVRAFIGTILLVARPPAPAKVVGDVPSAIAWLLPKLGAGWTAAELRAECDAAVERARRAPHG